MKTRNLKTAALLLAAFTLSAGLILLSSRAPVTSQTRDRRVNANAQPASENSNDRPASGPAEVLKVDVDLVTVDALVLQKKTARIVGGLKQEDFAIYEDGAKQEITHFSQDTLPLSVLLL